MAGLYKKYVDQGFHIIGLECQGSSAADIAALAQAKGVTYQLTINGDLKGSNVTGIPHGFLFSAEGKLLADDPRGKELENKVKEALKDAGGMMAGPGPYKKLASLAAQVKSGQGLGNVLKTLAQKKDSKDAEEAAEAKAMYEALRQNAQESLDLALSRKETSPGEALARLDKLASQFSGDEIGTKAKQEGDAMRKDPKTKKEIEAETMLKQIEAATEQLKPVRGQMNPKDESFRKVNAAAIQTIVGGCQALSQRYAGTAAAQKADELLSQYPH